MKFVEDVDVVQVHICSNADGRASGEAFIQLRTNTDVERALLKHQSVLGSRYVEGTNNFHTSKDDKQPPFFSISTRRNGNRSS